MPPPKKAAKKAAKKAPGHKRGQDTRRCYEHFGRVSALLPLLQDGNTVARMAFLAQALLRDGQAKDAADVLRAAEHLSFGTLAMHAPADGISPLLTEALRAEYEHLLQRADDHAAWGIMPAPVARLFPLMRKAAVQAFKAERLRAACEFARGAEALSHVTAEVAGRLRAGNMHQLEVG